MKILKSDANFGFSYFTFDFHCNISQIIRNKSWTDAYSEVEGRTIMRIINNDSNQLF